MTVQRLALTTTTSPTALHRIGATCARRSCVVTALRWELDGDVGLLDLEVSGAEYHVGRAALWLAALVEVTRVDVVAVTAQALDHSPSPEEAGTRA